MESAQKAGELELFLNDKNPQYSLVKVNLHIICSASYTCLVNIVISDDWFNFFCFRKKFVNPETENLLSYLILVLVFTMPGCFDLIEHLLSAFFLMVYSKWALLMGHYCIFVLFYLQLTTCSKFCVSGSCMHCNFGMGSEFTSSYCYYQGKS